MIVDQQYQSLAPSKGDQERASLVKINSLLFAYTGGGTSGMPTTMADLIAAVKGEDGVLASSNAFVSHFTLFTGPLLLWQLDCFSIAPALRWVFVQDSASMALAQMPVYIAPIYPQCSTSFMVTAPFQKGVTVGLSTAPNFYVEETIPSMLITAVRRT